VNLLRAVPFDFDDRRWGLGESEARPHHQQRQRRQTVKLLLHKKSPLKNKSDVSSELRQNLV
jgi:hypothetical protein